MSEAPGAICTWCAAAVAPGDGFRAHQPAGERYAVFCRLEHVVPWELQGGRWETSSPPGGEALDDPGVGGACAHCGAPLDDAAVALVRHRGEHRIADRFCSAAHMAAWAKAGGRWQ